MSMERFRGYTQLAEKRLYDFLPDENTPQGRVVRAARHSLGAGGKRIRPLLTMLFCEMCGGKRETALDTACAIEYMHTYSLIHDDLPCMDDDDLRRGKPSCHKAFDEATALLAGDALAILPFEIISSSDLAAEAALKCIRSLSRCCGITGMIGGQQIDTENEGKALAKDILLSMYSMKTSALLKAACECGVYCAAAEREEEYIKAAGIYAENLGLAFQIVDDILDVTSDNETLGKPTGSDERSDKRTFVSLYGLDRAEKAAAVYTDKAKEALAVFENNSNVMLLTALLLDRKH